ncbi:hypothetical protein U9M48_036708 [Paspalum notatum var. saurae]|uniref:Transposase MuDR plant domain-containing protein n=1 Tax=Paspalum notatum var. saurae TaxID=547442 RepID=A0AAQ3XBF2_PASNO
MAMSGQSPDTSWLPAGIDPIRSTQLTTSEPTEPTTSHPTQPTNDDDDANDDNDANADYDDGYLANPQPHNEQVGVDEEGLYLTTHKAVSESESEFESKSKSDEDYEEEDGLIGKDPLPPVPIVSYDKDDPPMSVGSMYPNMQQFRLALTQHAFKYEFEFDTEKSDLGRLRACCSRKEEERTEWKIKDKHKVEVNYKRVYAGMVLAQTQLFGCWDSSFNNLYMFKKEVERSYPGSSVVIDHHTVDGKIRFNRMFFAMKPCIDGFLTRI